MAVGLPDSHRLSSMGSVIFSYFLHLFRKNIENICGYHLLNNYRSSFKSYLYFTAKYVIIHNIYF